MVHRRRLCGTVVIARMARITILLSVVVQHVDTRETVAVLSPLFEKRYDKA
jgi:hypothetical protein